MVEGCCAAREDALNHPRESLSSPQRFSGPNDALTCALTRPDAFTPADQDAIAPEPTRATLRTRPSGARDTGVEAQSRNFVRRFSSGRRSPLANGRGPTQLERAGRGLAASGGGFPPRLTSNLGAELSRDLRPRLAALRPPRRPSSTAAAFLSRPSIPRPRSSSSISPVAIRMTWTALPITSAGRFSPLGLSHLGCYSASRYP